MDKINFINSQAPALNGANLNQLQTNIENAINEVKNENNHKGDFLNVSLSGDFTLSSTNYTTLPFKETYSVNGSSLSLRSSGEIVVGANVKAVRVSGMGYYYNGTDGTKGIQIYVNSELVSRMNYKNVSNYTGLAVSTTVNVSEGDVIALQVSGASGDTFKDYNHATQFIVEVIA